MAFRGRRRNDRSDREKAERPEWIPKTALGARVKSGEITSVEQIFEMGKPILEHEIVDHLIPDIESETLDLMNTQRMTDCGRKAQFRAIVLVGDRKGHFGIGAGKSEEVKPAIESAIKDAKRNLIGVPLGCGSWECGCKQGHSVPIKTIGKNGSVEVTLKPAPRGLGIAANKVVKRVLTLAGVKDVWSFSRGHTENVYNMAMAVSKALDNLNSMRYRGDWKSEASN